MPEPVCLSEALLQQSRGCYWIVDEQRLFHRLYGDTLAYFGKSAAALAGRPLAEVLPAAQAGTWNDRLSRAFRGETPLLSERRGDATWHIVVVPIRIEGAVRYAGVMAREVSRWGKAEQELRNAVLGALTAQEFERAMMSKFLHDSVGQNLTALGLQLDLARMDMEEVSPGTAARIAEVQKILETMMEEVREYSYHLNPSAVERTGLRSALDRLAIRVRERLPGGLRVNVDPSLKLNPKVASAFYQIAAEAVENSLQHSSCSAIEILVKSTRSGISLEVRDNGRGFDPADIPGGRRGLGLLSMEHYAAQAGLDLSITSSGDTGTAVRAVSPEAI